MTEEWRTISEFPDYEVSSLGNVRRMAGGQGVVVGKLLKWHTNTSTGYPSIRFCVGSKQHARTVHKVVTRAFLGEKPEGYVTRHLDGNKLNNRADNLRYGTITENNRDKIAHGTSSYGAKNVKAKLTHEDVADIRSFYAMKFPVQLIADEYGVGKSCIYGIVSGRSWAREEASNRNMDRAAA